MFKYSGPRPNTGIKSHAVNVIEDWIENDPFINNVDDLQAALASSDFKLDYCKAYLDDRYRSLKLNHQEMKDETTYANGMPIKPELDAEGYIDEFSALHLNDKDYYKALKKFKPDFAWEEVDNSTFATDYFDAIENSKRDNSWKNNVDSTFYNEYGPAVFLSEQLEEASEEAVNAFYKECCPIKVDSFEKLKA